VKGHKICKEKSILPGNSLKYKNSLDLTVEAAQVITPLSIGLYKVRMLIEF
jgi:hypothetical protein